MLPMPAPSLAIVQYKVKVRVAVGEVFAVKQVKKLISNDCDHRHTTVIF